MSGEGSEWVDDLPGLEGLFTTHATSLIRPFFLLSLPFFRRKSSSYNDPLAPLRTPSLASSPEDTISLDTAVKALTALQSFIVRFKADFRASTPSESQVDLLYEGYLRGFYIASKAGEGCDDEMGEAAKQCLAGYISLNTRAQGSRGYLCEHTMGAMLDDEDEKSHLLTPLFAKPRRLTDEIQHHHIQRSGKKALRDMAGVPSQVDPVKEYEEEGSHLVALLDSFQDHIDALAVEVFTGEPKQPVGCPAEPLPKRGLNVGRRRYLRIALESRITKCELAAAFASADIGNMKLRAKDISRSPTPELLSDDESSVDSEELDAKAEVLTLEEDTLVSQAGASNSADSKTEDKESTLKWDEEFEDALYECLEYSRQLIEDQHWMALLQRQIGDTACKNDSESEYNSDSESEEEQESSQTGPTPLRAIFRLHDRYEELRLAVWLTLPTDTRGKMSAYMRGAPTTTQMMKVKGPDMGDAAFKEKINGRIGEAWDRLGLGLLKECKNERVFTTRILQRHGLDPEKLDKWEELVSVKSSKRAKKGRKTV